MVRPKTCALIGFLTLHAVVSAQQVKHQADKAHSYITYYMSHPAHDWSGTSRDVVAVILTNASGDSILKAAVAVPVSSFDSKNSNRDSHAMEATEAVKFPNVRFDSQSIVQKDNTLHIKGTLSFHGVKQPIEVEAVVSKTGKSMVVEGKFRVTLTQFNIEPPTLLAIETEDFIDLEFHLEFL